MHANSLKIIFAGTPEFAVSALNVLLQSHHRVIAVYTQPDRPAKRGLKLTPSPVKQLALQYGLPIYQPNSLKDLPCQTELAKLDSDIMVVAAYGLLLPAAVLTMPRLGCINIHPSLLPHWRGAAPIQRTIYNGDDKTGVTIMQMDAGLDTGPILLTKPYTLNGTETTHSLQTALANLGSAALLEALDLIAQHTLAPQPQDNSQATYAAKIDKSEAHLDWQLPATQLDRIIRAFNPTPIAYTMWHNQRLRIWDAAILTKTTTHTSNLIPGTIIQANHAGIDIATGAGILRLLQVQTPGGNIITSADLYNAHQTKLQPGTCLT